METLLMSSLQQDDKHVTILKTFDGLKVGDSMLLINDHEPLTLISQMKVEKGNFEWNTIQDGPNLWKVQITKSIFVKAPEKQIELVGDIVAKDLRKAAIFEKYGIDYCCGGKKELAEVCLDMNIDYDKIKVELETVSGDLVSTNNYEEWSAAFLSDYIYNQHHKYFYKEDSAIKELMLKVVRQHVTNHPFLLDLQQVYSVLSLELGTHFVKEEQQIFPSIRVLDYINTTGQKSDSSMFSPISTSIEAMETDHNDAGKLLQKIRKLTNDFKPPANACNSFSLLYKKLSEMEKDLHLHIHLENNILFPAAIRLEEMVTGKTIRN